MFETDVEKICQALNMWANWIETGSPTTTINDAINIGKPKMIKKLNDEQRKFVSELRQLALKYDIKIIL